MSYLLAPALALALSQSPTDLPRWELAGTLEPLPGKVERFVVAPDGTRAATLGEDRSLVLWDLEKGVPVRRFEAAAPHAPVLGFSADSTRLAAHTPLGVPPALRVLHARDGAEIAGWSAEPLGASSQRESRGQSWREGPVLYRHPSGEMVLWTADNGPPLLKTARGWSELRRPDASAWPAFPWARWDGSDAIVLAESEGLVGGDGTPAGQVHNILSAQRFDLSKASRVGGFRADFLQPESDGFATRAFVITEQHGWVIQRGALHRYDLDTGKATLQIGNAVSAVAAEGEVVWTGHRDGSVRRWNAGKETACWPAPVGRIAALEVCGERVLAIGESPSAALLESGRVAVRFAPAKEARLQGALALFRSDERLAVYDGGKLLAEVPLDEWIYDARDGRQVPSVVAGGKVYFRLQGNLCSVDLRSGARWSAPPAHAAEVTSVDVRGSEAIVRGHRNSALVREKGEIVARFSSPRVVWLSGQIADLDELASEKVTNYHVQDSESAAALRAGDRVMVISGEDRKVIFGRELPGAHAPVALSRDGSMLAAASKGDGNRNSRITLFELPGGKPIRALDAGAEAELLEISPDGRFLAVRGRGFGTRVYTLSGEPMGEWPTGPAAFGESQAQRSFALLPGARLAGAFHDRLVFLRELPSGRALWESRAPDETYSHFAQLVPSPTGDAFAVHYAEPALLFVYGVSSPTPKLRAPVRSHRSFAFLPDGTLIRIDGDGLAVHRTGSFDLVGRHPGIAGEAVYPSREGTRLGVVQGGRLTTYRRL